ncbi:MAG: hypothetical protein DRJ42_13790 [Deltaproteobacteria bacterium]|nr:MAG: hypothetical protein DRJ42_13790 [Deltaproteobacteria bacterium]
MVQGSERFRFVTDQRGSVRLVVNERTGAIAQRMDYDAFGRVLANTNPHFQPFGFAGGLYDADTGLVRFGAREYDAATGSWLSPDPSGFAGGPNLYQYCYGDPINYVDPGGEFGHLVAIAIVMGESAAVSVVSGIAMRGAMNLASGRGFWGCASAEQIRNDILLDAVEGAVTAGLGIAWRSARAARSAATSRALGGACRGGRCRAGGCFVAGTMVETADGQRPIETIAPGDLVVGRDEYTGEQGLYAVAHTTVRPDQPILALEFVGDAASEALEVTGEHPIWARDRGWVAARDLLPGDEVFTSAGGWLRVSSGTWLARSQTVYNLDVEEADSYFVGERAVWVHNNPICPPGSRGGAGPVRVGQAGENAVRGVHNIGPQTSIRVSGRGRRPDGLTDDVLSEVKNTRSLSFTRQLRDFADFAEQTGRRFDLFVRPGARLSGPLRRARDAGRINIREIPQ